MVMKVIVMVVLIIIANSANLIPQFTSGVDESISYSSDPAMQHILQSGSTPGRYIDKPQIFPITFTEIPQILLTIHKIEAGGTTGYGLTVLPMEITKTGFTIRYVALFSNAVSTLFVQYLAVVDDSLEIGYLIINQSISQAQSFTYNLRNQDKIYSQFTLFCTGFNLNRKNDVVSILEVSQGILGISKTSPSDLTIQVDITEGYNLQYLSIAFIIGLGSRYSLFTGSLSLKYAVPSLRLQGMSSLTCSSPNCIIGIGFLFQTLDTSSGSGEIRFKSSITSIALKQFQLGLNSWGDTQLKQISTKVYIYYPCALYCTACINTSSDFSKSNPPNCDTCSSQYVLPTPSLNCISCANYCNECTVTSLTCISCISTTQRTNPPKCDVCPNGMYTIIGMMNCQPCPGVCGNCQNQTGICTSCASIRIGLPFCDECPSGYYKIAESPLCLICPSYCLGCTYSMQMISCTACQPFTLRINPPLCSTCPSQHYLPKNQAQCAVCPSYCNACISSNECISCNTFQHRINPPLCNKCEHQYYYDSNLLNCQPCPSTCNGCTSATDCIACTGTRLAPPSCQACPSQTFKTQTDCQTCLTICDGCTDANTCISCLSTTNRFNPPLCQSSPPKYYADSDEINCIKCDSRCSYCNVKSTNCLSCQDDTRKPPQCRECNNGYYLYYLQCLKCESQCVTCLNKNQCLACPINKYLEDGECVSKCQSGYYLYETSCLKCSGQTSEQNTFECIICTPGCKYCSQQVCSTCYADYTLSNGICIEDVAQLNSNETLEIHKTAILYIYLLQSIGLILISIKVYYLDKISSLVSSPTRPLVTQVLPLKQIKEEAPESGKINNENDLNDHSPLQSPEQPKLVRHQSRETSILKLKSPQGENITMFQSQLRITSTENFNSQTINRIEQSPQKPSVNLNMISGLINKLNSSQLSPMKAYMMYLFEFHQVTNIFKHTNPDSSRIQRAIIFYNSLMGTMAFIYNLNYGSEAQQVLIILAVAPINKIYQVLLQNINQKVRYFIILCIAVLGNYGFFDNLVHGTTSNCNFKTIYYLCAILFDNFLYSPLQLGIGFLIVRNIQATRIQKFLNSSSRAFLYGA